MSFVKNAPILPGDAPGCPGWSFAFRVAAGWAIAVIVGAGVVTSRASDDPALAIDFGPPRLCAYGYACVGARSMDERVWIRGTGIETRDRGSADFVARDFVTGKDATVSIGLDPAGYEVELLMIDPDYAHGPFDVYVQGILVARAVYVPRATRIPLSFPVTVLPGETLKVRFAATNGAPNFIVNALTVRGPVQSLRRNIYPEEQPPRETPSGSELELERRADVRGELRRSCDWLLKQRQSDGFLEPNSRQWYRAAFAARMLLAGYEIQRDPQYLRAAIRLLDGLLAEQLQNGGWLAQSLGRPVRKVPGEELQRLMRGTMNVADTGSIAACLSIASRYVTGPRREAYLAAHRRYADQFASQWLLPSGAFANGRYEGHDQTTPYSVATATQAVSYYALFAATGDPRYQRIADRAVSFLIDERLEDGRSIYHPPDRSAVAVHAPTAFGDEYYSFEALQWAQAWSSDRHLRERARGALASAVFGSRGLLAEREAGGWWPLHDRWTDAKSPGACMVINDLDRKRAAEGDLQSAVWNCAVFLGTPRFAARIGVATLPDAPWGEHSVSATSYAGLALAEMLLPGVTTMRRSLRGL